MLDLKFIENNIELIKEKVSVRNLDVSGLDNLVELLNERKISIRNVETLEHDRNVGSKKVGELKREGKEKEASELSIDLKLISEKIKDLNNERNQIEARLNTVLLQIPNIPHTSVPVGRNENDNKEVKTWGTPREFEFKPLDHVELGENLDILDLERASKIAGSRFALYKGLGACLERALINFMLDLHVNEHGYKEILPPFMANSTSFTGTGNLPKFEEDLFKIQDTDYYLIPTAEVPVTNIYRDEILEINSLPVKYVAYSPCFRKEAGSYGKDVHGIIRQHQFNKVELVKFSDPKHSYDELEELTADACRVLELLELPYRVVILCSGDLGFSSAKTYDIEVWLPSEGRYREISSCSNFEDFQARRANIKFKDAKGGKSKLIHTLNGSGVAIGRAFIAILENYQESDGSINIPDVLVKYMNGVSKLG